MEKIVILLSLLLTCFSPVSSLYAEVKGSSAYDFLLIEPDARAPGMACAVSSSVNDVFAAYWNPAGLSLIEKRWSFGYSHALWLSDLQYDSVAAAWNSDRIGTFALLANAMYMGGDIEARDLNGDPLLIDVPVHFISSSLAYGVQIYGKKRYGSKIFLGLTAKMVTEKIYTYERTDLAFDAGFIADSILMEDVNFSFVLRNLGLTRTLVADILPENLPFQNVAGVSFKKFLFGKNRNEILVTPALEIAAANDYSAEVRSGMELQYTDNTKNFKLFFRGGYVSSNDITGLNGLRFGVGGEYAKFTLDYALAPYGGLGFVNRISIKYGF